MIYLYLVWKEIIHTREYYTVEDIAADRIEPEDIAADRLEPEDIAADRIELEDIAADRQTG